MRCNMKFKDPLHHNGIKGTEFDGWSVTHFLLFMCLGYLFPTEWKFIAGVGLLWEGFEYYVENEKPKFLHGIGYCCPERTLWTSKWTDIFVNLLGTSTGILINHYMKHR